MTQSGHASTKFGFVAKGHQLCLLLADISADVTGTVGLNGPLGITIRGTRAIASSGSVGRGTA